MANRTTLRLSKEYEAIQKNPIPNVIVVPESENWLIWHFALYGLSGDFEFGVYHGELRFPSNYPMGPPSIIMHTPSGRFVPGSKICVSMSNFHPESWTPSWNISSMIIALVSYMYDNEQGIGTLISNQQQKNEFALLSFEFNKKNKKFVALFQDFFEILKPAVSITEMHPQVRRPCNCRNVKILAISFALPILVFLGIYLYYVMFKFN